MNQNEKDSEIEELVNNSMLQLHFSDLVKGFYKFWWVVLALSVLLGGIQFYRSYVNFVPMYTISSTFTVSSGSKSSQESGITAYSYYQDSATTEQLTNTFPYILSSNILHDAICEELKISYLPATLSASSVAGSNMFTITGTGRDPKATYDVLIAAIEKYPDAARYIVGNIQLTMITNPVIPDTPSNKTAFIKTTLKGVLVGMALGAAWILLYAISRKTIRTKKEIKSELHQNTIGVLPQVSFKKYKTKIDYSILKTNERIGSSFLESLRVLRNSFIAGVNDGEKVILVTSTAPGEGKTTVAANLALSLADLGKKVLLVDFDIRNPSVCKLLNLDFENLKCKTKNKEYSIAEIEKLKISILSFATEGKHWDVIRVERIEKLFNSLRDSYDYILVDTPPCGLVSDTSIIAQAVDAAVYVVKQDTVRVSRIKTGLDNIIASYTKVIGCVFNGAASGLVGYGDNYGYGYGYGKYGYGKYGYGYGEEKNKKSKR